MTAPDGVPDHRIEIVGGAGDAHAAAIAAAVEVILRDAEAALAVPTRRPRQSQWVMAWRPRAVPAPLPSATYDPAGWGLTDDVADDEPDEPV